MESGLSEAAELVARERVNHIAATAIPYPSHRWHKGC
jgi:hypothetical protein